MSEMRYLTLVLRNPTEDDRKIILGESFVYGAWEDVRRELESLRAENARLRDALRAMDSVVSVSEAKAVAAYTLKGDE